MKHIDMGVRKLVGFIIAVSAVVLVSFRAYTFTGADGFDSSFATNVVIAVCTGVGTLYATFVGGNYGEHAAKAKNPKVSEYTRSPKG